MLLWQVPRLNDDPILCGSLHMLDLAMLDDVSILLSILLLFLNVKHLPMEPQIFLLVRTTTKQMN